MKTFQLLLIVISIFLLSAIYPQQLKKTTSIEADNEQSHDLGVVIINSKKIRTTFYNDGNFVEYSMYFPEPAFPGLIYEHYGYLRYLHLWVGIPGGPWSPKTWNSEIQDSVSLGPTVSGTYFSDIFLGSSDTDWGPLPGVRGQDYSGDLLLSDLMNVSNTKDAPVLANSSYELTWPEDIYGNRVWSGEWTKNHFNGSAIPGKFCGDQEALFKFTDAGFASKYYPLDAQYYSFLDGPLQGYDIGATVLGRVLAFNELYNENFLIYELNVVNMSAWDYHDAYIGLHFDPIVAYEKIYYREWGPYDINEFIGYILKDSLNTYNMSYYYSSITPDPPEGQFAYLGIKLLQTPKMMKSDGKDNDHDGHIDEIEGEQLGLTGWHYVVPAANIIKTGSHSYELIDTSLKRGELILYKVMSGDTTGLLPLEKEGFFHSDSEDPNFDKSIIHDDIGVKPLMCTGPFNWNSGDTVRFAFAVVFGENLKNLKFNCRVAQKMYDNYYRRMEAPYAPTVSAVQGDRQVTLYWDDAAEKSADFLTGYPDFEGYRIYRTSVDPSFNQWGEEIKDGNGELVGFVPLAQFDVIDDITGLDPRHPHLELGFDSGIQHSWTDTTIQNGVTYWFAVCAYDRGINADSLLNPDEWPLFKSLENGRGTDESLWRNLVEITPGAAPSNYQTSTLYVTPLPATKGNGLITAELIDPQAITGHVYTIIFDDTSFSELNYSVTDENKNNIILQHITRVHGEEGPIFDGIRLQVQAIDKAGLLPDSSGWLNWQTKDSSDCNYLIEAVTLLTESVLDNYEIRFTEKGDTSYILHKPAPFEVWNISRKEKLDWEIFTNSTTDTTDFLKSVWSSGDYIRIREQVDGALKFSWDFILTRNPETKYIERDTLLDGYPATVIDTLQIDNPPETGDVAHIVIAKPFHSGDRFCLQTQKVSSYAAEKNELAKIKVVPNPYLVTAGWELHRDDFRISFTHLPAKCEIMIFNVVGDVVAVLKHEDLFSGTAFWDLNSHEGMEVATGLYLYVVKTHEGKSKEGKFVVIR